MSSKIPILMNDKAGLFRSTASAAEMQRLAYELDVDAEVIATQSAQHMVSLLKEYAAKGAEAVAVAGGDGTTSLAARTLACTNTSLGIIAQGTANNFATALRLPGDLPSALRVLADREMREIDLGRVGDRYFIESAGVGLFANALSAYGQGTNKNFFRGIYAIMKIVLDLRAARVKLTIDGKQIEEPSVFCVAANTYRIANGLPIAPGAKLTDGVLDVLEIGNLGRKELIPYYQAIRRQVHLGLPKVAIHQAREIRIEAYRRMPVHCDDGVLGTTPVTIRSEPKALRVLVERI
jgi:YegS/Rv2252/BmrU family lipid kinase